MLTLGRPVLNYPENPNAERGATSTIVKDFGMSWPGIEPSTSRSRSGHSTYCATEAGDYQELGGPTKSIISLLW